MINALIKNVHKSIYEEEFHSFTFHFDLHFTGCSSGKHEIVSA